MNKEYLNLKDGFKYEGNLKDGVPHGKGTAFNFKNGVKLYQGEFRNGNPSVFLNALGTAQK